MQKRQRDVAELDARYTKDLLMLTRLSKASVLMFLLGVTPASRRHLCKINDQSQQHGRGESPRLTADSELNYYRLRSGSTR